MLRMDQVHVIRPKVLIERQSICSGVFSRTVGTNLRGRPESACTQGSLGAWRNAWDPPVLSFTIERHSAMGMASTRAELQRWLVDIDRKTARCERNRSYRQALPQVEGVRAEPIAKELADSVVGGPAIPAVAGNRGRAGHGGILAQRDAGIRDWRVAQQSVRRDGQSVAPVT
jgi:hypothetical protein